MSAHVSAVLSSQHKLHVCVIFATYKGRNKLKHAFMQPFWECQAGPPTGGGGQLGHFSPGPSLKGAPEGPMKGPPNPCLKDRYTLIEQSDLNTLIEQSQYSSEEQCSKLIDKEIWLVMGSYCCCQQVVTFFFFFLFFFFGLHLTTWVKGPTLTLCPGPLNFSGRPWCQANNGLKS